MKSGQVETGKPNLWLWALLSIAVIVLPCKATVYCIINGRIAVLSEQPNLGKKYVSQDLR